MSKSKSPILSLILCLLLFGSALPNELWVRNKPFTGQVEGSGTSLKIELGPLLEALGLQVEIRDENLVFGDFLVPIETTANGTRMVLLRELAMGANLQVKTNTELGTIDVYSAAAGDNSKADWSEGDAPAAGSGGAYETADYSIKVPPQLEFTNDPAAMAALKAHTASTGAQVDSSNFRFVISAKNSSEDAVMLLMTAGGLPPMPQMPPELEMQLVQGFAQGITQRGGQIKSGPTPTTIGGRRFHKYEHTMQDGGVDKLGESYIYVHSSRGEMWALMMADKTSTYPQNISHFRKAFQSFRIK